MSTLPDAIRSTGASRVAVLAVAACMRDGLGRTDEEIAALVRRPSGKLWAPDTVRHARLALQIANHLRWNGHTRPTVYGVPSCVWVWRSS